MIPSTRAEARAIGSIVYFTGKLCTNGHVARRYTAHTTCVECNIAKSRKQRSRHSKRINATKRAYNRLHPARNMLAHAKKRAKTSGVPFSITAADIAIPESCPVLGIILSIGNGNMHSGSPTLDRIIPELGYVSGNVAVISQRANMLKSDGSLAEHTQLCDWLRQQL